jgi:hypothetical protein
MMLLKLSPVVNLVGLTLMIQQSGLLLVGVPLLVVLLYLWMKVSL